jgi:hypothetical protein
MRGWVSLARDFSTPPPQDPDFQRAFAEAYDALWEGRSIIKPFFSVDSRPYPYVLEPIANDDLPRILADAKTNPEIDGFIRMGFRNGAKDPALSLGDKWAIDRVNDSYLFNSRGLGNPKIYRDGYLFFYRGKAFGVYVYSSDYVYDKNCHAPEGKRGWVSLSRNFSTPPPQDLDFQRAFTEARDVYCGGRSLGKVVFSKEQQDQESAK